jgi:hypothetical protein
MQTEENRRLLEAHEGEVRWRNWGPYLVSDNGGQPGKTIAPTDALGSPSPMILRNNRGLQTATLFGQ